MSAYSFVEANICSMHARVRLRMLVKIKETTPRTTRLTSVNVPILVQLSDENRCNYAVNCMLRELKMATSFCRLEHFTILWIPYQNAHLRITSVLSKCNNSLCFARLTCA